MDFSENIDYSDLIGQWCNIDLQNWDSGYYKVIIVAQNETFLMFFQAGRKSSLKLGVVRTEYIDNVHSIQLSTKKLNRFPIIPKVNLHENENPFERFLEKICDIQLHGKSLTHVILSNDGYQKSEVLLVDENRMKIKDGKSVAIIKCGDIAGIVES